MKNWKKNKIKTIFNSINPNNNINIFTNGSKIFKVLIRTFLD